VTTSPKSTRSRAREPRRRGSRGARIARWGIVFLAVAVIVDAVVGERGLMAMLKARDQYEASAAALDRQRAENERLREEVVRLKDDPAAIEELARGELGLMRPGEKLFIVKDLKPPAGQ
jgi:cell division protein FtsB